MTDQQLEELKTLKILEKYEHHEEHITLKLKNGIIFEKTHSVRKNPFTGNLTELPVIFSMNRMVIKKWEYVGNGKFEIRL